MAHFLGTVFSEVLNMDVEISAILPQDSRQYRGLNPLAEGVAAREKPRTLILLHGLTDSCTAWVNRSRLLCHAEEYGVAVIMPAVQRSFYQDMACGEAYFTYVTEELPALAAKLFNVSVAPEDLMVAGQSMGGYGALRCGLTHPERYRAVGAFSSVTDIEPFTVHAPVRKETRNFDRVVLGMFGEAQVVPDAAKLDVLAERSKGAKLPVYMTCGSEDPLLPESERFYQKLIALGYRAELEIGPGAHEWNYWDGVIQNFLARFA